jgi:hypothetical protein
MYMNFIDTGVSLCGGRFFFNFGGKIEILKSQSEKCFNIVRLKPVKELSISSKNRCICNPEDG